MCDCRVCQLEIIYPENIDKIVDDVFNYLTEEE